MEGPFYRPGAPWRTNFNPSGEAGDPLIISGTVRDTATCDPMAGATVDVWAASPPNADGVGDYDNTSPEFKYRGRVKTDCDGNYSVETLLPGAYPISGPGSQLRPKHVHFRVTTPGGNTLVTQMYFKGDPYNNQDPFYDPSLESELVPRDGGGYTINFDIALAMKKAPSQTFQVAA